MAEHATKIAQPVNKYPNKGGTTPTWLHVITRKMVIRCITVVAFPSRLEVNTFLPTNRLNTRTARRIPTSRLIDSIASQAGILIIAVSFGRASTIRQEVIRSLSAKGSSIFPRSVVSLRVLAKRPSRASVMAASPIVSSAQPYSPYTRWMTSRGTKKMRKTVSQLASVTETTPHWTPVENLVRRQTTIGLSLSE